VAEAVVEALVARAGWAVVQLTQPLGVALRFSPGAVAGMQAAELLADG
jgi:hypothetical protein